MNVLIIPEDFRKDQYLLKPIVEAMLASIGKPRAMVRVCRDPLLRGVSEALNAGCIRGIIDRYAGMTDLFLLCVDRDGDVNRRVALDNLERKVQNTGARLLGENAWQELEVWALAGHNLPSDWSWRAIREDPHPKERYFEPFAALQKAQLGLGGGRKRLAEEAARRYSRIRQLCPEDVGNLERRICDRLTSE